MIDVLVTGAAGNVGLEVLKAVTDAEDMRVCAAVDPSRSGTSIDIGADTPVICSGSLTEAIAQSSPDVMVDFTHPTVVEENIRLALAAGVDCVVGTTGLSADTLRALADGAVDNACLFVAPNFAIGAVLMMRFAAQTARYLPHVEIIELHHDKKADAPSGTALRTASLIAETRASVPDAPSRETEIAEGARGALVDDVSIHSIRLPGMVAHQEVLFGGQGQTLSIRHDTIDRTSFMPGVLLATRKVGALSGLVIGLENVMEE